MVSPHTFVRLLGLFVLCHYVSCACFFKELVITDLKNPPKGCLDDDGKEHGFGSQWVRDCKTCSCDQQGLSCCDMIPAANEVDVPDDCELIVDKKACSAKLVYKSDKTRECSTA